MLLTYLQVTLDGVSTTVRPTLLLNQNQTRRGRRRQTSSLVLPPSELDKTYVSSLILAHSLH